MYITLADQLVIFGHGMYQERKYPSFEESGSDHRGNVAIFEDTNDITDLCPLRYPSHIAMFGYAKSPAASKSGHCMFIIGHIVQ